MKGDWDAATIRIWPISNTQTWPPPKAFDDTIIDLLIERLNTAEP